MANWRWNGARWWKFDFHAHTPASEDYGKGTDQAELKQRQPKQWLLDYMRAGIDCVAVTDHDTGKWIDVLKAALAELRAERLPEFRDLYLFPGVEIEVNGGVHLLTVLGPDRCGSDVDKLLGAVGIHNVGAVTGKTFPEVVEEIVTHGGIAIPAHVDRPKGLFELSGKTLAQALDCQAVFAMETFDLSRPKPSLYAEKRRAWTEVLGSDSHHSVGDLGQRYPGSHFTWVKMAEPNLDGLRLALLDGPLSIRRSDCTASDPNVHAGLIIESIEISGARYMGRPQAFRLDLNPWFNVIIGGRGTGKSTLIEFLRTALRREEEIPDALKEDFAKYTKICADREDEGLLTSGSQFVVTYRKDATRYRVKWSAAGTLDPIEVESEAGGWKAELGDVKQRFPVRIYSQKQIFELAKTPLALLKIVDQAPDVDRRSWEERRRIEETRFLSLRAQAREIRAGLADESRLTGELEDIKRKLAVFEGAGHASVLKEFQKRTRQRRAVEAWEEGWSTGGDRLRAVASELVPEPLESEVLDGQDPAGQDLFARATAALDRLKKARTKLEDVAADLDGLASDWRRSRDDSPWKKAVDGAVAGYEDLLRRLVDQGAGDPSAYGLLVQRRQAIETQIQDMESRRKQVKSIEQQAASCVGALLRLRRELTERRREFVQRVLKGNPYVRIGVVPHGASETVASEFRALIQREGGGFEKDIGTPEGGDGLLGGLYSGGPDAGTFEKRLENLKGEVRSIAGGKLSSVRDQRFANHLVKLPPEALDRLDIWFPSDTLYVEYSVAGGKGGFQSIKEGSPGQKTAALLAFLLPYGEEPIVLDQPEDDLDNRLITDLVVSQIREIKPRRQILVVTHNANIVVNGDAELVVALAAPGGQTRQECAGSLQERKVREKICEILEGGREAFRKRYRRISPEDRHV